MLDFRQGPLWCWLLLLCLLCVGCYDGEDGRQAQPLSGIWGGYFPGSSLQHPENGIEIQFDRPENPKHPGILHAAGFIHRDKRMASRHDLKVEQRGIQVNLIFSPGKPDESVFSGAFVDDVTVRGTFTNASRGESFPMDLLNEKVARLAKLQPVSDARLSAGTSEATSQAPALSQGVGDAKAFLTLQLAFTTTDGNSHRVGFGYGPWFSSIQYYGYWQDFTFNEFGFVNLSVHTAYRGASTVRTMVFYPDWLLLELFESSTSSAVENLAALELHWSDLIALDGNRLATESWAAVLTGLFTWEYSPVQDLTMAYIETDTFWFDVEGIAVRWDNPGYRNVVISGQVYRVPGNTQNMLKSLGFALPYQQ